MIKPRCLIYNMPVFLSADNKLKPCCFLNPIAQWNEFKDWAKKHNFNIEDDLDVTEHSIEEILSSPTWLKLIAGFETGDTPLECHRACGAGSYRSTTQTAKHSDYKAADSSSLTSTYKKE